MGLILHQTADIVSIHRLNVEKAVVIDRNCYLHCGDIDWCKGLGGISIGYHTYIGPNCVLFGMGGIKIGNNVMIAPNVTITSVQHPTGDVTIPMYQQKRLYEEIVIDDDVYIGSNVVVIPGVRIGQGSVVAAGATVIENVEPFKIVAGTPAKVVKERN